MPLRDLPRLGPEQVRFCAPVERQEVWAAGVTYLRSRTARMEESGQNASVYDRVYTAERPELFFKALADKVVASGDAVGIRRDAAWSVPEPELALVINSRGRIVGYTIGNDMSSRDIEGENPLYLPQAKIYDRACALGPWITLGGSEAQARAWTIRLTIRRLGDVVFAGETEVDRITRAIRRPGRLPLSQSDLRTRRRAADRHRRRSAGRLHAAGRGRRRDRGLRDRRTEQPRGRAVTWVFARHRNRRQRRV